MELDRWWPEFKKVANGIAGYRQSSLPSAKPPLHFFYQGSSQQPLTRQGSLDSVTFRWVPRTSTSMSKLCSKIANTKACQHDSNPFSPKSQAIFCPSGFKATIFFKLSPIGESILVLCSLNWNFSWLNVPEKAEVCLLWKFKSFFCKIPALFPLSPFIWHFLPCW